jgi:hypothetical protein
MGNSFTNRDGGVSDIIRKYTAQYGLPRPKVETGERWTGVEARRHCKTFQELRAFVDEVIRARVARCLSPDRTELCDSPAVRVYWQDQAEWYPCCELHTVNQDQWTGSTHFRPHVVEIPLLADRAEEWHRGLTAERRAMTILGRYPRSDEEQD